MLSARNNFRIFNSEIRGIDFPEFQYRIFYDWLSSGKHFGAIEEPRGHGKTELFTKSYVEWQIFRSSGVKIAIASSSLKTQTYEFMQVIQNDFENNEYLKHLVPKSNKRSWSVSKMQFENGSKLIGVPFGPGARGTHVNLMVLDDILRDLEVSIETAKQTFWDIMYPTVQTLNGYLLLVGTPMSDKDLFFDIEKRILEKPNFANRWFFSKNPAVKTDSLGNWIEPLWSERYSLSRLRDMEEDMGVNKFAREYLLEPTSFGASFFSKESILNSLSSEYSLSPVPLDGAIHYMGCDFAYSTSSRADYSAFVVVSLLPGEREIDYGEGRIEKVLDPIIIRNIFHAKGVQYQNQLKIVLDLYKRFKVSKVVIDKTNIGSTYYGDLRGVVNVDGQDFPMVKRNALITNLQVLLDSGRLVFPYKDKDNTRALISQLIKELKGFSLDPDSPSIKSKATHDDIAIALALAVRDLKEKKQYTGDSIIFTELDKKKEGDEKKNKGGGIFFY